jgi:hypothetical protein
VLIRSGVLRIWHQQGRLLARVRRGWNHLYLHEITQPIFSGPSTMTLLGAGMSVMGISTLMLGLPHLEHVDQFCNTCHHQALS